jgi:hypothetical protein
MGDPPDDLGLFVINTGFDFKANTSTRQDGARKLGSSRYTESEREKAEMAVKPLSLADLQAKVRDLSVFLKTSKIVLLAYLPPKFRQERE